MEKSWEYLFCIIYKTIIDLNGHTFFNFVSHFEIICGLFIVIYKQGCQKSPPYLSFPPLFVSFVCFQTLEMPAGPTAVKASDFAQFLVWLIWREPLEPGVSPTSPDDWPSAKAKSLTHVSIYTSVRLYGFRLQAPTVYVYANMWLIMHSYTEIHDLYSVHMSRINAGSCSQKIQMFCFVPVFFCLSVCLSSSACWKPNPKTLTKTAVCEPGVDQISLGNSIRTVHIMSTLLSV